MECRLIGPSQLRVSAIGVGCVMFGGRLDAEATRAVVDEALAGGVTLFDTADVYGRNGGSEGDSETVLGSALQNRRQHVVLATKFGLPMDSSGRRQGASRRHILESIEGSLRRLKTDWIDLYQLHWPDPGTPIDETLRALDDLIKAGKVRYIGCSQMAAWEIADAQWTARSQGLTRFVSTQAEYSLIHSAPEYTLLPALRAHNVGLLPYFPLAGGLLSGKFLRSESLEGTRMSQDFYKNKMLTPDNLALARDLHNFASERNHTLLELAFGWLLTQREVASVIAGASTPEQVRQNIAAASAWSLSEADKALVSGILARHPTVIWHRPCLTHGQPEKRGLRTKSELWQREDGLRKATEPKAQ